MGMGNYTFQKLQVLFFFFVLGYVLHSAFKRSGVSILICIKSSQLMYPLYGTVGKDNPMYKIEVFFPQQGGRLFAVKNRAVIRMNRIVKIVKGKGDTFFFYFPYFVYFVRPKQGIGMHIKFPVAYFGYFGSGF